MFKFEKQGYKLYSPPKTVVYHQWDKKARNTYQEDFKGDAERREAQKRSLEVIRKIIMSDEEFVESMKRRGVDMVRKTCEEKAQCGGIDPAFL